MLVRALDSNHDWTFGSSLGNYLSGNAAVAQLIQTNVLSFVGDCFFATTDGVDWINLIGLPGGQTALNLSISTVILNTTGVTGLLQLSAVVTGRKLSVTYKVQTVFSVTGNAFTFDFGQLLPD